MKIKRYIGNTTHEAMEKVRRELGSDAVILHTRNVKGSGIFKFFKKSLVEIVAAYEDTNRVNEQNIPHEYTKYKDFNINSKLENEINNIKNMVESVVNTLDTNKSQLPNELSKYLDSLVMQGVDNEVAFQILNKINQQINIRNKDNKQIREIITYSINDYIGDPSPIIFDGSQKIIFFVGPTGVGKTTTLAKIAAHFSLDKKCSVGMITADTYRIAAVEQLKVYAEIMNIPLRVVYEMKDIYKSMSNFRNMDIILIDTAGRNHRNQKQIDELRELIDTVNNKEVHLVINTSTDFETIKEIINSYNFIKDFKIIFSKIDEARVIGNILNTKFYFPNAISYFTTGQNVPDDIEIPNIKKLNMALIGETRYV